MKDQNFLKENNARQLWHPMGPPGAAHHTPPPPTQQGGGMWQS